ncbi:MAG: hypothetical protein M9962_05435 [Oligoflexia bacterium]|nr:hypothetical protein [Oligoflexia bacterium]
MFLFFISLLLIQKIALASCPVGEVIPNDVNIDLVFTTFGAQESPRQCTTSTDDLELPLQIEGCYPVGGNPEYLVVRAKRAWNNKCFKDPSATFTVKASQFFIMTSQDAHDLKTCNAAMPESIEKQKEIETVKVLYEGRDNPVGLLINDINAAENSLKSVEEIEKYNSCIARQSGQSERDNYKESFRFFFEAASVDFGVPLSLMNCLCGRESKFDHKAANGSARGLCQAMEGNLSDINRWIQKVPELKSSWSSYLNRISKYSSPSCRTDKLTQSKIMECPELAVGAAAVYLVYGYSRIEGNGSMRNNIWNSHELSSMIAIGASYNVGVGTAMKAVKRARGRSGWDRALLQQTCDDFSSVKFNEVRGHIVSLRNCMVQGSWLDHQGKLMKGNCVFADDEEKEFHLALAKKYENSLPAKISCRK